MKIIRNKTLWTLVFMIPLLSGVSVFAQNKSVIHGFIFSSGRVPLERIRVEISDEVNTVLSRTTTDQGGRYSFGGLSSGRFTLTILPLGTNFDGQTKEVQISGYFNKPETIQVDFYLNVRKNTGESDEVNGVVFAQDVPEDARELYKKALADLKKKRSDEGVAGLKNAIGIFPTFYLALDRLGYEYIRQEKFEESLPYFAKAVEINSKSFDSWYGYGYSNFSLKNWARAAENLQNAVSINSNSMAANYLLGVSLRTIREFNKAESALLKAKELADGKSPDVHWNLALLYAYNLNRYKDAAKELELYLKAEPESPNKDAIKKLIKEFKNKPPKSD